ncbi:hypothetical protein HFP72_04415 [Nocardiopsis sp. ARC36]
MTEESRIRELRGTKDAHARALVVLRRLGERWLTACLMDLFTRDFIATGVKAQAEWLRGNRDAVVATMGQWPQIRDHAFLSKHPSDATNGHKRGCEHVALQLLGALALHDGQIVVRELVERAYRGEPASGWRQLLTERGMKESYRVDYPRSGTRPVFHVTFTDSGGRTGVGSHRDKEAARTQTAEDYQSRHVKRVIPEETTAGVSPRVAGGEPLVPQIYKDRTPEQGDALARVRESLDLGESGEGWIAQAFTDVSWAEAHRSRVLAAAQKDNRLLAYQGAIAGHLVRTHVYAKSLLARTLEPDEDEIVVGPVPQEDWKRFLDGSGAIPGLLVAGEGAEASAVQLTAAKALLGVCWRVRGSTLIDSLAADMTSYFEVRTLRPEPAFWMRRMRDLFGVDYRIESHRKHVESPFYQTELVLEWGGYRAVIEGPLVLAKNRNRVSDSLFRRVLGIAERLRSSEPWNLSESERPIARLLIAAQLAGPAVELDQRARSYLVRRGYLGWIT